MFVSCFPHPYLTWEGGGPRVVTWETINPSPHADIDKPLGYELVKWHYLVSCLFTTANCE